VTFRDKTPVIGEDAFVAETATVIGDVAIGKECSIWFSAVVRGDVNSISIGHGIQSYVELAKEYGKHQ